MTQLDRLSVMFMIKVDDKSYLNATLKRCVVRLRLKLARVFVDLADCGTPCVVLTVLC